jgi:hypothetical protein
MQRESFGADTHVPPPFFGAGTGRHSLHLLPPRRTAQNCTLHLHRASRLTGLGPGGSVTQASLEASTPPDLTRDSPATRRAKPRQQRALCSSLAARRELGTHPLTDVRTNPRCGATRAACPGLWHRADKILWHSVQKIQVSFWMCFLAYAGSRAVSQGSL